jgi:hypothetical protein
VEDPTPESERSPRFLQLATDFEFWRRVMILKATKKSGATMRVESLWKLTVRRYSALWNWRTILPLLFSLGAMSLATSVFAAQPNPNPDLIIKDVRYVDCGSTNKLINTINNALASLDPSEDNTIYVRGACKENVNIVGFDRLQLIAQNGASISDASGDTTPAISIDNSTRVSVQGFIINGSGPNAQTEAIDCTFSYCAFSGNTVQGGNGRVDVFRGARASFSGDVLQNNNGAGIFVAQNGFVVAIAVTTKKTDRARTLPAASCRSITARFKTNPEQAFFWASVERSTCLFRPSREMEATASTSPAIRHYNLGSGETETGGPAVPSRITQAQAFWSRTSPSLTSRTA